jgi:glutaredoxin-related protein
MSRKILPADRVHPSIANVVAGKSGAIIDEIEAAIAKNDVVVVGMAQNPHCKRARRKLDAAGKAFEYLEYGSYLKEWRPRLELKMWTGWPTFPMVFVKGTLVGGADDITRLIESGDLDAMLA